MRIRTTITIGLALFVLAVAGANASNVKSAHHTKPAAAALGQKNRSQTAAERARARALAAALAKLKAQAVELAKLKAQAAELAKLEAQAAAAAMAPGGPNYIYVPGPTTPTVIVDPNECQDSGTNCSDLQACEFWGENCGSIPWYCLQAYADTPASNAPADPDPADPSAPGVGTSDGC